MCGSSGTDQQLQSKPRIGQSCSCCPPPRRFLPLQPLFPPASLALHPHHTSHSPVAVCAFPAATSTFFPVTVLAIVGAYSSPEHTLPLVPARPQSGRDSSSRCGSSFCHYNNCCMAGPGQEAACSPCFRPEQELTGRKMVVVVGGGTERGVIRGNGEMAQG